MEVRGVIASSGEYSTLADTTASGLGPELRERMASTVLQFGAQPSSSLPSLIASFAAWTRTWTLI
ncbi:hypothetical protein V8D89_001224 [Ganoderma adspersum]